MINPTKIWSMTQLPSLPTVAVRLLELSQEAVVEQREIVQAVLTDPAMSARIVRAANTTYFGVRHDVSSVEQAASILGATVTSALALNFSLVEADADEPAGLTHYRNYWQRSLVQSAAATVIAEKMSAECVDQYSLCGLLLDVGRLALLTAFPTEYRPVLEAAANEEVPLEQLELAALGLHHADVGSRLMERWKLPAEIVEAIRWHHVAPEWLLARKGGSNFQLQAAMALASRAGDLICATRREPFFERLHHFANALFHWSENETQEFVAETELRAWRQDSLCQLETTPAASVLTAQANDQLVKLTLRSHDASVQAKVRQQAAEKGTRDLESENRQLQKQALHDPLTEIYNRQFFDEMLETETKRSQRCASPIGVIFADVDHFKQVNDTYGHQFGDYVLKRIARLFASTTRTSDVLARYGGEEFVVLVSQPTEKGLERRCERIRSRVESEVFLFGDVRVPVTVSLGAVLAVPGRNERDLGVRLIANADECLYESKRSGRNRAIVKSLVDERERALLQQVLQHRFSRWLVSQRLLDVPSVSKALLDCRGEPVRVGDIALQCGYLDADQVMHIVKNQEQTGDRFGVAAVRLGWLTENQLIHLLSLQQENPKQLAGAIIRLGLLAPDKAAEALDDYLHSEAAHWNQSHAQQLVGAT